MNQSYFACLLSCMLLISISCTKDDAQPTPEQLRMIQNTSFLKMARSDAPSEYYISGVFNGVSLYCATTFSNLFPYHDTAYNYVAKNNALNLDQVAISRENQEKSIKLSMYLSQSDLFAQSLPYVLPRRNTAPAEGASITLTDLKNFFNPPAGKNDADFVFTGQTHNAVSIQVLQLSDSTMSGTFSGSLTNKEGSSIVVKDGRFKIKLKPAR